MYLYVKVLPTRCPQLLVYPNYHNSGNTYRDLEKLFDYHNLEILTIEMDKNSKKYLSCNMSALNFNQGALPQFLIRQSKDF